jgi:hypothetical protein
MRIALSLIVLLAGLAQAPGSVPTVKPAEASVVGTIDRFEEASRRLVVVTKEGHVAFVLASDAVVRLGSKLLAVTDLAKHKGSKAKIRYTQQQGKRMAHWVTISSDPPRVTF